MSSYYHFFLLKKNSWSTIPSDLAQRLYNEKPLLPINNHWQLQRSQDLKTLVLQNIGLLFKCNWKMKSIAPNPSLKKAAHTPKHHWCRQQKTTPAKGKRYHRFNTLQQRKLPGQVVSAAPQHPLTTERVSLVQVNGIEEHVYNHRSVLNPSQVFKLQNEGRMMQCWKP